MGPENAALPFGTALAESRSMKRLILISILSLPAAFLLGCDTPEDCGNPFGCSENSSKRMSSNEVGQLIGVEETATAILLDEEGYTPELDEESDELFYTLSNDDLETLAIAAD
jgi:hypothetical protein